MMHPTDQMSTTKHQVIKTSQRPPHVFSQTPSQTKANPACLWSICKTCTPELQNGPSTVKATRPLGAGLSGLQGRWGQGAPPSGHSPSPVGARLRPRPQMPRQRANEGLCWGGGVGEAPVTQGTSSPQLRSQRGAQVTEHLSKPEAQLTSGDLGEF